MLPIGGYYRFQHHFKDQAPELDDHCQDTIKQLQDAGKELVENNEVILRTICRVLDPESS